MPTPHSCSRCSPDPTAGTRASPTEIAAVDYRSALTGDVAGLRVGILTEGFGQPGSLPKADELVRSAARRFTEIGCTVGEISVPWHRNALHVFNVIFTDGATYQMLDGNGYGLGFDGLYDPELMAHFAKQRADKADELASTIKETALCGHYGLNKLGGASYAKARNLLPHVRAAYDAALAQYDVLVMPTVPGTADTLPAGSPQDVALLERALGKAAQHRTHGHHRPSRDLGTRRSGRRPASRNDDRGQAIRRRHRAEGRRRLRIPLRGFPFRPDRATSV